VPHRDIIVLGGSAGSIPSLINIVSAFPDNLPAAVFVIIHFRNREKSNLAHVLSHNSRLSAQDAVDGEKIKNGRIYVAVPDRHLFISEGHIHLTRGPKEGLHRPCINATFRSAAQTYRDRVIGVLCSGLLDDGASGLWEIVRHHGMAIVQDPAEAQFPSMPLSALADVSITYTLKSAEIGPCLVQLVTSSEDLRMSEAKIGNHDSPEAFSGFTCPECRGPLYKLGTKPPEFQCRVGHRFPLETLVEDSTSTQERKMYEAIVSLEEGADMAEYAASQLGKAEHQELVNEAKQLRRHAATIRQLIEERQSSQIFQ